MVSDRRFVGDGADQGRGQCVAIRGRSSKPDGLGLDPSSFITNCVTQGSEPPVPYLENGGTITVLRVLLGRDI